MSTSLLLSNDLLSGLLLCVAGTTVVWFMCKRSTNRHGNLPLPPGPKKLPLLGNLLDMPSSAHSPTQGWPWEVYAGWGRQYGSDILHLEALGNSIVIINTHEAAVELLSRRSTIYSSRPRMVMVGELMGWDFTLGFLPYGSRLRTYRKILHHSFNEKSISNYHSHLQKCTHMLLQGLMYAPTDYEHHLHLLTERVTFTLTYGIDMEASEQQLFVSLAQKALAGLNDACAEQFLCEIFPWLKYIPAWLPGASFRRRAKEWKKDVIKMTEIPFERSKEAFRGGATSKRSLVADQLSKMPENEADAAEYEEKVKNVAASIYAAGSDSMVIVIQNFIANMLRNRDCMLKAQREIDLVLQSERLPTIGDFDSLPYVTAIVKETLRMHPVLPTAIPYVVSKDDVYNGYHIPAKSIVFANAWAILRSNALYADPHVFDPDRFMHDGKLNPNIADPADVGSFGFGRRECPGKHLGFTTVWLAIASILAVFDLRKGDEGLNVEYEFGITWKPKPFKCVIEPRSDSAKRLIQ